MNRRNLDDHRARRARRRWNEALVQYEALRETLPFDVHAVASAIGASEHLTPTWALRVRCAALRRRCAALVAPVAAGPVAAPGPAPEPTPVPSPPPDPSAGLGPWARVDVWRHGLGFRWRATWAPPCEPDSAEARGQAATADEATVAARAWVEGLRF